MPMRLVRPGRTFVYKGVKFLRIEGLTDIGKTPYNLVHQPSGKLGWVDGETAVKV